MNRYDEKLKANIQDLIDGIDDVPVFWLNAMAILITELQFLREDVYDAAPKKGDW